MRALVPSVVTELYRALMWAGHLVCHQMPARSPHLFGAQLPLCWRCTGIALGSLALVAWLIRSRRLPPLGLSLALSLLLPLDVLHALATGGGGNNARRLLTGALWGFFAAPLALRLVAHACSRLAAAPARRSETGASRRDSNPTGSAAIPSAAAAPPHAPPSALDATP